jgi:adenosylmethionine-8-amino-7-oxononanoate aminotransferase
MHPLAKLDQQFVWHPFTQMQEWMSGEPIVIREGEGAILRDVCGREYLDGNASIWTNLHGHRHPALNRAIERQLRRIAHSSSLGFANEPASLFAAKLVRAAGDGLKATEFAAAKSSRFAQPELEKVFYSDDGSTAMEVALKLAYEFTRRTGRSSRPKFLSLDNAYHGDTVGTVSLGHIDLFHKTWSGLLFRSDKVMAPYCYRCPFNRAKPERGDAREYRKCQWECVRSVNEAIQRQRKLRNPYAAMVVEPLVQGAAGIIAQPRGWLRQVADLAREDGALLIADEVMTGFGRTGVPPLPQMVGAEGRPETAVRNVSAGLFASHREGVQPDLMALGKGMAGGYLPMAATLTTRPVFDVFLGRYEEFKTFFHGHSFSGNQLGSAAALASLTLLQNARSLAGRRRIESALREELASLWDSPWVGDIRQEGLIAGIELVRDWRTRERFALSERVGIRVCEAMSRRGVLTRPIGNVVVLMPPYCVTRKQVRQLVAALRESIDEISREFARRPSRKLL